MFRKKSGNIFKIKQQVFLYFILNSFIYNFKNLNFIRSIFIIYFIKIKVSNSNLLIQQIEMSDLNKSLPIPNQFGFFKSQLKVKPTR